MKKFFVFIVSFILFSYNLCAQINDSVLIDYYGKIRADMVRDVCQFVGFQNDSLLKKIKNASLKEFKTNIAKNDTLIKIINEARSLDGTDIVKYQKSMRETRRAFRDKLVSYYPNREGEIEEMLLKYMKEIDGLTEECFTFSQDKEHYLSKYPNGKFYKFFDGVGDKNQIAKTDSNTKSISTPNKSIDSDEFDKDLNSSNSVSLFNVILFCLVLFSVLYYIKRKKKNSNAKHPNETNPTEEHDINTGKKDNKAYQPQIEQEIGASSPVSEGTNDNLKTPPSLQIEINHEDSEDGFQMQEEVQKSSIIAKNSSKEEHIQTSPKDFGPKGKCFAVDAGEWIVVGASVQGNGHISMDMPCQDNHGYEYLGEGWGIAIVSDGAGSAKLSHIGSKVTVSRALLHFKELVEREGWKTNSVLPSDIDWMKKSYKVLKRVRDELEAFSNKNNCVIKDLSATIISIIHSPLGLLVAHIGDGRAGYKDMSGKWHSVITPHKGEEANQTIFIPSDFWNIQFYEMSGATVPESKIIKDEVAAFTLMSDGCENTSWLCNQFNEDSGKYYDPNQPFGKFFEPLLDTLQSFRTDKVSLEEREDKWYSFIKEGNKSFIRETDDKTMILGALYM